MSHEITLVGHHSAGHDVCPPVPVTEGASTVRVAGHRVARVGDKLDNHECPIHEPHQGIITQGAPHVCISGYNVARKGDLIDSGPAQDVLAEGLSSVRIGNCGGEEYGRELILEMLNDPHDKLLMCIEEIAAAEYELANEINRQGLAYLQEFITKWLNKKSYSIQGPHDNGGQDPYFIEWDWLMKYTRFYYNYLKLKEKKYLFSERAKAKLVSLLEADGKFSAKAETFDYINVKWDMLRGYAFQNRSATLKPWQYFIASSWFPTPITPDGLMIAVANVTIFATASGTITYHEYNKKTICIEKVAFFIHDGFEFSGDQTLGWWDCDKKQLSVFTGYEITNKDFRTFREHTGYGCDFRIMSKPELVWQGEYCYDAF